MTDDLRARLEEDQRIIDAATDGPWEVLKERVVTEDMDLVTPRLHSEPEAEFIAASRTRWEQTNRALLAVLELHRPSEYGCVSECRESNGDLNYPCPTARTITDKLTGGGDGQ